MKSIFIIIITAVSCILNAQYKLQWYSVYDNPHPSYNDFAEGIVQDNLGNSYVTGTSFQIGLVDDWRYDFATIKYNSSGDSLWVRRYDSAHEDRYASIGIDAANNVYVTGNSYAPHGTISILKYDANGNQLWIRSYSDTTISTYLQVTDMVVDSPGNVFLAGSNIGGNAKESEIIKYSSAGDVQWVRKYFVPANDLNNLISLTLDNSGNIVASGCVRSSGSSDLDFLTVKYSPDGDLLWSVRTDQTVKDIANCVRTDKLGNVYIAGYSKTTDNLYDFKIIKYNSSGSLEWIRSNAGRSDIIDLFHDYGKKNIITIDSNESVYVDFITFSSTNVNDIATAKFNQSGELKWINTYNIGNDIASDIKLNNSNIFVTGYSQYDTSPNSFAILIYDTSGLLQKVVRNENQFPNVFSPVAMSVSNSGDIIATGSCLQASNPNATDYFTVKYSNPTGINVISNITPSKFTLHQNYPNPFNPVTKIRYELLKSGNVTLKIYDITGREVQMLVNQRQNQGVYEIAFDRSDLAGGMYFYTLRSDDFSETKKMVIVK